MTHQYTQPQWSQLLDTVALDHLAEHGWWLIQQALPDDLYQALYQESCQSQHYQSAGVAHGQLAQHIRSDQTRWLDDDSQASAAYLVALQHLSYWLNQQLYLGVQRVEAHYARYEKGQHYAVHRDNVAGSTIRAISTVLYLNDLWQPDYGGALRIEDHHGQWQYISPEGNHLIIFDSQLRHEVQAAQHTRRSIAGWLRRDIS